jgi:plastocyanin
MKKNFVTALGVVGCLTVLAACGDTKPAAQSVASPTEAASPAQSSMPEMSMSPTSGPAVSTSSVAIKEFAFGPTSITVKIGTTVTWTNEDQDPHTVTSQDKSGPLRSATMNNGDAYRYTFTKAGSYSYLCTIHPFLTGTVVVTR